MIKTEDVDINQNRKLIKTIVVKGDSNITSATIDDEGSLLIVSTAIDVKAFRLEHQDPVKPSDVKISSAELPAKLAGVGAIKVQLSPNAQWLCAIQEGSRVVLGALDPVTPRPSLVFSPNVQRLTRLRRQIPRHILNGGLGSYDRTITQVAFSPDSKMLAASDIAGYIDTWILSDGEKIKSEDDASSSSESDSSDEEEETSQNIEKWIRNPGAKLLPKLPSAATVLSFSADVPRAKVSPRSSFDGINGAADLVDDYTLLAITSSWNLLTFHPLQGSLTPWSRRHVRKDLPAPVQDLLDLAKGVFWEGSRAWIYGVSFLLMLDLAQDLPKSLEADSSDKTLKRKRTGPSSGAGGRMEQGAIAPSLVRKHTAGQWEDVDMEDAPQLEDANSDDEADQPEGELAQLRNRREVGKDVEAAETGGERKSWWMTFKYRPIFGVVPISTPDQPLEVALVERPTWDVDMPESYFSVEQWRK
jgi:U3 small nucleolar RNA-associated protein 4